MKPEERLTIEGVLAHPWLNCTEALDNVLPSAQMMMDKVTKQPSGIIRSSMLGRSAYCFSPSVPGGSRRYPAGSCRTVGQHEDSGSECQPEAPKLR